MRTTSTQWRFRTVKSNSLQHRSMTYVTDAMERILLDSLADRAATEQNRRKTVTQSRGASAEPSAMPAGPPAFRHSVELDRKSTRLNSSHTVISYAVFCLKKKKKK